MINPNGLDLDNMSRDDNDSLFGDLISIIEDMIDTMNAESMLGADKYEAQARGAIKEYEDMSEDALVKEIKSRGWDAEVLSFGITVIDGGNPIFHGREDEVRAWLNK